MRGDPRLELYHERTTMRKRDLYWVAGYVDAEGADAVIQVIAYGEIVFG